MSNMMMIFPIFSLVVVRMELSRFKGIFVGFHRSTPYFVYFCRNCFFINVKKNAELVGDDIPYNLKPFDIFHVIPPE